MKSVLPLLATVVNPTRPLGAALPLVSTLSSPSPWSPREAPVVAAPQIDVEAIRAEAIEDGRTEGFAETDALRTRLAKLIERVEQLHTTYAPPTVDQIAEAAAVVVDRWFGQADRRAVFEPIIRGWAGAATPDHAIARVHPDDYDAMRDVIGSVPLELVADDAIAPGDVEIRSKAFELVHRWDDRLVELRAAIAAALAGSVT